MFLPPCRKVSAERKARERPAGRVLWSLCIAPASERDEHCLTCRPRRRLLCYFSREVTKNRIKFYLINNLDIKPRTKCGEDVLKLRIVNLKLLNLSSFYIISGFSIYNYHFIIFNKKWYVDRDSGFQLGLLGSAGSSIAFDARRSFYHFYSNFFR